MSPRVLLVDDDAQALAALARILSNRCDVRILAANGAKQALDYLGAGASFDLIVVDYNLPGISGTHLLALCMEQYPDMRRAIYTGDDRGSVEFADVILRKGDDPIAVANRLCELARSPRG